MLQPGGNGEELIGEGDFGQLAGANVEVRIERVVNDDLPSLCQSIRFVLKSRAIEYPTLGLFASAERLRDESESLPSWHHDCNSSSNLFLKLCMPGSSRPRRLIVARSRKKPST